MASELTIWLIVALPAFAFVINGLVLRWLPVYGIPSFRITGKQSDLAGWLTVAAVGVSFIFSLLALIKVASDGAQQFEMHSWIAIGGVDISFGMMLDQLTAIMLVVVSGVSLLVQIYGIGYMHGDDGYTRYFSYMALFTASMLGLVTARSVIQLFVFWELVGISSYLLIGFWMNRPSAAEAAKKAFLMTRFGDFGFLLAILYLYSNDPSWLDIEAMYGAIAGGMMAVSVASWIALGFLLGAIGKSAQFPLHSWLPDAMEGPTSVSALIHSATMVTAGVFLVARFFPLFEHSDIMFVVALVGAITAVFAASMALVADDIKRVLAYSTVSQLGYMMFALGIGAYGAAVFHLFTHAFFKACLFLAAGSVHHAGGTFNMNYLGGLRDHMKITYWAMVIASLSLAGIVPLSGFWSKDEILAHAAHTDSTIAVFALAMGLIGALMTAFYMFRAVFKTFHGDFRGGGDKEREDMEASGEEAPEGLEHVHLGESPYTMIVPISILAFLAIVAGFFANPVVGLGIVDKHAFSTFVVADNTTVFPDHDAQIHAGSEPKFDFLIAGVSTILALSGVALAWALFTKRLPISDGMNRLVRPIRTLFARKYFFDELYEDWIVSRGFYGYFAMLTDKLDIVGFDNVNVQLYRWTDRAGRALAKVQDGQVQTYGIVSVVGLIVAIVIFVVVAQ